jgi:signal transduction histidine kinase
MLLQSGAVLLGLLLVSAASLWGIHAMTQDFSGALRGYEQVRRLYEVASHVTLARHLLAADVPQPAQARAQIDATVQKLRLPENESLHPLLGPPLGDFARALAAAQGGHTSAGDYQLLSLELDRVNRQVADLSARIREDIQRAQAAADAKRHATIVVMAVLAAVIVVSTLAVGVLHYRSVMTPLRRLAGGVRTVAAGDFGNRIDQRGPAEFADLAADFNRMAAELHGLYTELEEKVAAKSRELVRSERLASVGYLAAGVAHEINNPLGIITGHAELALRQIGAPAGTVGGDDVVASLRIICEEAFRCKTITAKLLSLAKPGAESRQPISLAAVAQTVVGMLSGLREFGGRSIALDHDRPEDCTVMACEGEMKQVVLNLAINALEAVAAGTGKVGIQVRRRGDRVTLQVSDNGRGMTSDTLGRIFEPFFTDKRGQRAPGTGLGLSITHAIVESHGGTIRAESTGLDGGSRFVVELPAVG